MSLKKSVSQRLQWARVALFVCSAGLGVVAAVATTSGCEQKQTVSKTPPAADADMKKVIINVFGMT
jgi:hypothetical protein